MIVRPRAIIPPSQWDAFVWAQPGGWIWQTSGWLDYLAVTRDDYSVALVEGRQVVGLIPLLRAGEKFDPTDPLPAPLGVVSRELASLRSEYPAARWRGMPQRDRTDRGFSTRVIDLTQEDSALWRDLRKSYHALIHRAEERHRVRVGTVAELAALYAEAPDLPQLHAEQWACLRRLVADQFLLVLVAEDAVGDGGIMGAVGVYFARGWAYYGHGRSREPNVNHLLHWAARDYLRARNVQHYEIGWEAREDDDAKAHAIAFHKAGFTSGRWWVPVQ